MIRFEGVKTEYFKNLDFIVARGARCGVLTGSVEKKRNLFDIISGIQAPRAGRVFLFGKDIYSISRGDFLALFRKVGVVLQNGGLISNLKVWENIALPVSYHTAKRLEDVEAMVLAILRKPEMASFDLKGIMGELPASLPVQMRKAAGVIRAMTMNPELMLYDSLFDGLTPDMANKFGALTMNFHNENTGRTSVYVASDRYALDKTKMDNMIEI